MKPLFKSTPPLSMLTPLPPAPTHRRAAEGSKTERQGRPSRGTPTPPGYGYLTRHLPRRATHTRLSGSASRQASPSARNEEETRLHAQIPRCSGLDSHNEQTPILRVPLQMELRFHSRGYELPPHQRVCGTTNSRWLAGGADSLVDGETFSGCHHLGTDDSVHLRVSATPTNGGRPSLHWQIPTQVLTDGPAPASARRRRAGVRTRQSKNTNAALAACDVLDDPPVQSATRGGSHTCPTCARRDCRPCGGWTATP
jgi:hypothetical protein